MLSLGLLYTTIVISGYYDGLRGDELGYVSMATDLAAGRAPQIMWWGPGYPLLLASIIRLGLPMYLANLANVLFMLGTLAYLRSALCLYLPPLNASVIALAFGLYPPFWFYASMVLSEKLAIFLMGGSIYHYLKMRASSYGGVGSLAAASLYLAFLALTKVFYGYVILACLSIALLLHVTSTVRLQRTLLVLGLAILWCVPWLGYTYQRSGHIFYWATSGGSSLYWMSTPYPRETGSWFRPQDVETIPSLRTNHYRFYQSAVGLSAVERDDLFKREAIHNIITHPLKFLSNCSANASRLIFDFPYDYLSAPESKDQRLAVIASNTLLLTLLLLSFCFGRVVRHDLLCVGSFGGIALLGSIPLNAYNRMFTVLVPILVLWIFVGLLATESSQIEGDRA